MIISIFAIVIALCSLIWNVISAIRSWRLNRPLVKLELSSERRLRSHLRIVFQDTRDLCIEVQNRGGAPVAVTAINISIEDKEGWISKLGSGIDGNSASEIPGVKGPPLPFAVN